jgi:hypothetical protein
MAGFAVLLVGGAVATARRPAYSRSAVLWLVLGFVVLVVGVTALIGVA